MLSTTGSSLLGTLIVSLAYQVRKNPFFKIRKLEYADVALPVSNHRWGKCDMPA
jgi:hypothetical protein